MDSETDEFEFDFFPEQSTTSLEEDGGVLWDEESDEQPRPRVQAAALPPDVVRRRRIAAGAVVAFVLLIIIIVVATSGSGGGAGPYRKYLSELSPIASHSGQAGVSLAAAVSGKQTVSTRAAKLDDLVQQAIDDIKRLQAIRPPVKLAAEHAQALVVLDFRLRGLQGISGSLAQAVTSQDGTLLSGQIDDLVTSDKLWESAVRAPGNAVLQANGLGGQSVPASSVVPDRKSLLTALQKLVQTQTAASGPDLSLGSKGQDVVAWQNQLNRWLTLTGSTQAQLTPDGTFGAATQTTTEALQNAQGLTPDGVVGASTRQALQRALAGKTSQSSTGTGSSTPTSATLSLGSKGQDVVAWQNQLNQWLRLTGSTQPQLTPDGTFGAATQTVTETLQTAQGLAPSGVVDTRTRQALTTALARSG